MVAALPELLVGLQFLLMATHKHAFLGASARTLTRLMQAEFLVIHSMAFLGFIALWKPVEQNARRTRAVAFWGLFGLYCAMALSQGFAFFAIFFGLAFVTYLGLFMNWGSESARLQLGARWICGFIAFMAALTVFGAPESVNRWTGNAAVVKAGALYFFALAALELSGLYLRWIPANAARLREMLRKGSKRSAD